MRECDGSDEVYREIFVVCRDPFEGKIHRSFRKRGDHNKRFEEISDGSRQRTVMNDISSGDDARFDKNRSTCRSFNEMHRSLMTSVVPVYDISITVPFVAFSSNRNRLAS